MAVLDALVSMISFAARSTVIAGRSVRPSALVSMTTNKETTLLLELVKEQVLKNSRKDQKRFAFGTL